MLHYSLVATVADRFYDLGEIGSACLRMVAKNQGIELSEATAKKHLPRSAPFNRIRMSHSH